MDNLSTNMDVQLDGIFHAVMDRHVRDCVEAGATSESIKIMEAGKLQCPRTNARNVYARGTIVGVAKACCRMRSSALSNVQLPQPFGGGPRRAE
jgi:hypothetical protein